MKIGIDISQLAYEGTGVATYLQNLVENLLKEDTENEYIFFYSSLRKKLPATKVWFAGGKLKENIFTNGSRITIVQYKIPPVMLEFIWNRLHVLPIERFVGNVDIFLSSDWVQPPTKARKATILYDLIVYKYPEETHNKTEFSFKKLMLSSNIVMSQKRRLKWVKREVDKIICISEATKKDAIDILKISPEKLEVVYPGL